MIDTALSSPNPWLKGIDRERLEREGHIRLNFTNQSEHFLPFANGNFPTRSGKAELYSEKLKDQGLDPVVQFTPPSESRHSTRAKAFPLELLARKADNFLNTTFSNLPTGQEMEETGVLEMHPADAHSRRVKNDDRVRVFNSRGEIFLTARVDGKVQEGVVSARLHWAKLSAGNININVLTGEKLTDIGNAATFYSTLVEVEAAARTSATN